MAKIEAPLGKVTAGGDDDSSGLSVSKCFQNARLFHCVPPPPAKAPRCDSR
jgi:hypothetical protein